MVKRGATVGANATIVALNSVPIVIEQVRWFPKMLHRILVFGVPARHVQWVDKHGQSTVTTPLMSKLNR